MSINRLSIWMRFMICSAYKTEWKISQWKSFGKYKNQHMKMNVQMIWNGTNHDWFKTDKAHKLDENVYVFNKNNGRKRSFKKKISKYSMNHLNTRWMFLSMGGPFDTMDFVFILFTF